MSKRLILIVLSVLIIAAIVVAVIFVDRKKEFTPTSTALIAVPLDASLIVESYHFKELISKIRNNNKIYNQLVKVPLISKFDKQLLFIDSLLQHDNSISTVLENNSVVIAASSTGKNKFDFLYCISFANNSQFEQAKSFMNKKLLKNSKITEKEYNNSIICEVATNNAISFYYSFTNGIFIFSFNSLLVEESILHLSSENQLTKDKNFSKIVATSGKNVNANIYINHETFPRIFSMFLNNETKNLVNASTGYAEWTELDVNITENEIVLNGFTLVSDSLSNYLSIFLNQSPASSDMHTIIPSNVSTFAVFNISNYKEFTKSYKNYIEKYDDISQYNEEIKSINSEFSININNFINEIFDTEIGIVISNCNPDNIFENSFSVLKTKGESLALDELKKILNNYAENRHISLGALTHNYEADKETKYQIYEWPIEYMMKTLFGAIFADFEAKYFTFVGNYLIFGKSVKSLSEFLHENLLQRTLNNDERYKTFENTFENKSNFYLYSYLPSSSELYQYLLNDNLSKQYKQNADIFRQLNIFALKFKSGDKANMIYNDIVLNYNSVVKQKAKTIWETKLDTTFNFKPRIVANHKSDSKEIIVQDLSNKLYLINNIGRIEWKKSISEQIMSDIFQVDCFKNNKIQYLFSTKSAIHLIDVDGNYVEGFPVKLKSSATNSLACFDYDKNKDYRILIACNDKKIYAYNIQGKLIEGWNFSHTDNIVINDIQHFRIEDKDYIVVADKYKVYILDRKGNIRVSPKKNFAKSKNNNFIADINRLVTTDTLGNIVYQYFDGKIETQKIKQFSSSHYFDFIDINGDNKKDFVFTDNKKIEIYDKDKSIIFSYSFDENITDKPTFYLFPENQRKIGIVNRNKEEIYLFNNDGSLYKGFPLTGRTLFSIGNIENNENFNLFVGSGDKFLYNYEVQ